MYNCMNNCSFIKVEGYTLSEVRFFPNKLNKINNFSKYNFYAYNIYFWVLGMGLGTQTT